MIKSQAIEKNRLIDVGPAGFLPPSAMQLGVQIPPSGSGLLYGNPAVEDVVIEEAARQMLTRNNPTIFPGPPGIHCHYANLVLKMVPGTKLSHDSVLP